MKVQQWIEYARASFFYLRLWHRAGPRFFEYGERYLRPWAKDRPRVLATGVPLYAYFNGPDARAPRAMPSASTRLSVCCTQNKFPLRTAPRLSDIFMSPATDSMSTSAAYQQNKAQSCAKRQQSEGGATRCRNICGDSQEARRMGGVMTNHELRSMNDEWFNLISHRPKGPLRTGRRVPGEILR